MILKEYFEIIMRSIILSLIKVKVVKKFLKKNYKELEKLIN